MIILLLNKKKQEDKIIIAKIIEHFIEYITDLWEGTYSENSRSSFTQQLDGQDVDKYLLTGKGHQLT